MSCPKSIEGTLSSCFREITSATNAVTLETLRRNGRLAFAFFLLGSLCSTEVKLVLLE